MSKGSQSPGSPPGGTSRRCTSIPMNSGMALASLAKACASDAYMQTAIHTIQIHGGIGFTWDNDTHLWFKRAKSSEVFLGQPSYHRELLMQRWGV